MSQQARVSLGWLAVLAFCLAGFLSHKTTVLSTAASAMALVINGAR